MVELMGFIAEATLSLHHLQGTCTHSHISSRVFVPCTISISVQFVIDGIYPMLYGDFRGQ